MHHQKIKIMGVSFDKVTLDQAYEKVLEFLGEDKTHIVVTPNSEIVMAAQDDKELLGILNEADMVVADGIGVVLASRFYGKPLPERVAGFDLMTKILEKAPEKGHTIFLLGGKPGIVLKAAEKMKNKYPGLKIAGFHHGYFDALEEKNILKEINSAEPDFLFVAMGAPKQEKWIYSNKDIINARVCMGVGGSLDVYAGITKRAPAVFRKLGLEWFYRLIKEPRRIRRMMALPRFAVRVLFFKE
ncbi:MAG: N-acetylglucosaminyldiphosphoundecaprenol N-acetyl-beta-D-mannosaminyltransferase [Thermosediminibacterales bacterium]|nr:N-acetylglucosaminyldiphosphoundecaprenol N-acetyl-beta-D-mannosaminyltransferase [Thermosediminibacterales bacterium]